MTSDPPDPPDWAPVISLGHQRGRAAVCRDADGSLWMVYDFDGLQQVADWDWDDVPSDEDWDIRAEFGHELAEHEIVGFGTSEDGIAALAGMLPPGAVRVSVRDRSGNEYPTAVGNGLWLALPEASLPYDPLVLFLAEDDSPVRRPVPREITIQPMDAGGAACPACATTQWELAASPHDESTGDEQLLDGDWLPGTRAAVCTGCGHREQLPKVTQVIDVPRLAPEKQDGQPPYSDRAREAWEKIGAALGFPPLGLFGDSGLERRVAGWGRSSQHNVDQMTLDHGEHRLDRDDPWISVTTDVKPGVDPFFTVEAWLEPLVVGSLGRGDLRRLRDDDGDALRRTLAQAEMQARVRSMPQRVISMPVNDEPVAFVVIGDDVDWAAYAAYRDGAVTLHAYGVNPYEVQLTSARQQDYF